MVGVAALALGAGAADAKAKTPKAGTAAAAPRPDDGLGPHDVYIEADKLIDDREQKTVTGLGNVEVRYQGRTLRADRVIYSTVTGAAHASGGVTIINPDGTVEYSRDIKLDDQFRSGVALGFAARLQGNTTLVAGSAIRRSEDVNELNTAIYTPCAICKADGVTPKKPTWSIQATRIIQDHRHQVIYYRNAVIRVLGVPIFYAPIFWHPDPTAERRSGFLTPKIQLSSRRGLSYTQPYLWVFSPSADLRISPQFNTAVAPFLDLHYRERFYSGFLDLRAGYTYEKLFDNHTKFGDDTSRSYILGTGQFKLDHHWTVGFGAERVTDPTLFRRYQVQDVFTDRGPFPTDTDRLISQVYANRQDEQSYFSVAALSFESLRAAVVETTANGVTTTGVQSRDTGQAFPIVVPVTEGRYDLPESILGGRLRVTGSAVALTRNNPVIDIVDPLGISPAGPEPYSYHGLVETARPVATAADPLSSLVYRDSRRISADANWQSTYTFNSGIRLQPFAELRGSLFSTDRGELVQGIGSTAVQPAESFPTRGVASIGATASWPFLKSLPGGSLIIEPIVQVIASNQVKPDPNIPNEDSVSFEYDESTLFDINRFPGYDLDEGGTRMNIGIRSTVDLLGGRNASLLIGRTFRTERDPIFSPQSGLQGDSSDWVTAVTLTPISGVSIFNRARLDADSFDIKREEAGLNLNYGRLAAGVRYLYQQNGVLQVECTNPALTLGGPTCPSPFTGAPVIEGTTVVGRVENAELTGSWFFTKHWGVTANVTRDFVGYVANGKYNPVFPVAQLGLSYQDDCIRVDAIYTHDETYSATIGPSNSLAIRLTLTTLGGTLSSAPRARNSR